MARILLADDDETLRLIMGRHLHKVGHEVTLAENGLKALALLEQTDFDVVLSDMKMPGLDGVGLLSRAAASKPGTEFIIITGYGSIENAVEAFNMGNVSNYLLKPIEDIRALDAAINRALERRRLRTENERLVAELRRRIQELEEARAKLEYVAQRDGLTGALTHRAFHHRMSHAFQGKTEGSLVLVVADIDNFRYFNDAFGQVVGDHLLRHVAAALRSCLPEGAIVGRTGGDTFSVFFQGDAEDGNRFAESVMLYLSARPFRTPEGAYVPVQLSFGVADTIRAGHDRSHLVAAADGALHLAKAQGGGGIRSHGRSNGDGGHRSDTPFAMLDALVTMIHRKDRYTRVHSEEVTRYALMLAQRLDMSEEARGTLRIAALLHDVGKIAIPDRILQKPGRLTPEEYEIVKMHSVVSANLVFGLPHLEEIRSALLSHHERWDGKGYPQGLAGEQIPYFARILAVADAFAAMRADQPYRAALSLHEALTEIEANAGLQFDPNLAAQFVQLMRACTDQASPEGCKEEPPSPCCAA
ncbi:MAG: HD domain-containing phosphohydrolase [Chthonomonadales bacterium]